MRKKLFANKTVFVTGGSSGIGLASAKLLYRNGANVFLFARRPHQLSFAAQEILNFKRSEFHRVDFLSVDVSDRYMVHEVMKNAINDFGIPDIVINCAGRAYPNYFEKIPYEQFIETMSINLYGSWHVIEALLPFMKKNGGYIVNTSSIAGSIGLFGYTDYCASKFAVIGFSEALRSELKRYHITVSVLCPPDTDTPGFEIENKTKPPETRAISGNVKLLSADKVARGLIKGMKRKKFIIIPGLDGKLTFFAKRHFPWLVDYVMEKQIRKISKK